ncbi:MAG TPA: tail fiber domain-containing protein [Polyangiaceae bacterium]|nr:tail fiber domain-containing protein [Polyangiaceae bacterium]
MASRTLYITIATSLAVGAVDRAALAYDSSDTAYGTGAGAVLSTGTSDTAFGYNALNKTTTGSGNTAVGRSALFRNKTGASNTAVGNTALYNGTGNYNTAVGDSALSANGSDSNVAIGASALASNGSGGRNTAVGSFAMQLDTGGVDNVAVGGNALGSSAASYNVGVGVDAMSFYINGSSNTAVGTYASSGFQDDFSNTGAFGFGTEPTQNNEFIFGNSSATVTGGYTDWANISDARFKTSVLENVPGLAFVMKLRPVTFKWDMAKLVAFENTKVPPSGNDEKAAKRYTGFLAQEVEQAAAETDFDFSGVIRPPNERSKYMLTYAEFVVPLVKAVQEQQRQIEDLRKTVDSLRSERLASAGTGPQQAGMLPNSTGASGALIGALIGLLLFKRQKASVRTS